MVGPMPRSLVSHPVMPVAAAGLVLASACTMPLVYAALLGAAGLAGLVFLLFRHTTAFCVVWLAVTGMTIEMALNDLIGPAAFQASIAAVKAVGLALAVIGAIRWGWRPDPLNPAWAFTLMAATGLAAGLYPGLTPADSIRSWIGSVAPFAFCFCRPPRRWADAILATVRWCPAMAVAAALVLDAAGLRALFIDSGGFRLAGVGHPAFLAGVTLTAVCACLIEVFRHADRRSVGLLAVNLTILLLTGARAPLAYAVAVTGLALAFVPAPALSPASRGVILLSAAALAPVLVVAAGDLASVRVFNLLQSGAANLSGREYLWPSFQDAADAAPVIGWGIGAGNVVIAPESAVAKLLRTWAAHNEYLRIRVEGGWFGLLLLLGLFSAWVWRRSAILCPSDRGIARLAFLAYAALAFTDNVLISTPACVMITFAAALFARGEADRVLAATFALPDSGDVA